jgi:hypothetical protein
LLKSSAMRGDFMAGSGSIRRIFFGPEIGQCDWRRRIILGLKINPQNWWVIERANSQFRNRLKSLQSAARELQTPEVPRKAQWVPSNFPPTRARGSPAFPPSSANAFRRCSISDVVATMTAHHL